MCWAVTGGMRHSQVSLSVHCVQSKYSFFESQKIALIDTGSYTGLYGIYLWSP